MLSMLLIKAIICKYYCRKLHVRVNLNDALVDISNYKFLTFLWLTVMYTSRRKHSQGRMHVGLSTHRFLKLFATYCFQ